MLQTVNHAIALDSANALALVFQVEMLALLGRVAAGGEALQRAMQIDRLSPVVHNARNHWFMSVHKDDSRRVDWRRCTPAQAPRTPQWR